MVQAVHMSIGGQGHIAPRYRLAKCILHFLSAAVFLHGIAGGFQGHPRRHGYQGRIAGIHHRQANACRHVFLGFLESVFQALELAPVGKAVEVELLFDFGSDHIGIRVAL